MVLFLMPKQDKEGGIFFHLRHRSLRSLARNKRETRFSYHYGDINLWLNIDGRASM